LLVFLQFCSHLNVGVQPSQKIRNLLYPVSGTASRAWIVDNAVGKEDHDCQVDRVCSYLQSEFSRRANRVVFMDEIEPMLCNAFPSSDQRWEGRDIFIKGQYLFRLDEHGSPFVKYYESLVWSPVPEKKDYYDELVELSEV
jgi:hypothetical protein